VVQVGLELQARLEMPAVAAVVVAAVEATST